MSDAKNQSIIENLKRSRVIYKGKLNKHNGINTFNFSGPGFSVAYLLFTAIGFLTLCSCSMRFVYMFFQSLKMIGVSIFYNHRRCAVFQMMNRTKCFFRLEICACALTFSIATLLSLVFNQATIMLQGVTGHLRTFMLLIVLCCIYQFFAY